MADRFKCSDELLEEGQLLLNWREKILNEEERLKEDDEQKEKVLESLQLQNIRG